MHICYLLLLTIICAVGGIPFTKEWSLKKKKKNLWLCVKKNCVEENGKLKLNNASPFAHQEMLMKVNVIIFYALVLFTSFFFCYINIMMHGMYALLKYLFKICLFIFHFCQIHFHMECDINTQIILILNPNDFDDHFFFWVTAKNILSICPKGLWTW